MNAQLQTPDPVQHFVYSPASSYPVPFARLIDREGDTVHEWTSPVGQPDAGEDPPSFLRGWNHVEVAADGCLFAVVPLRAVLKLAADSTLLWQADVAAHHDLALLPGGGALVLAEAPRRLRWDGVDDATVLDNTLTEIDAQGRLVREVSLFDVLATDPALRTLVGTRIKAKQAAFARDPGSLTDEAAYLFSTGASSGPVTRALRLLRQLQGSPCDILHANTLEVVDEHPTGLWPAGSVLVSLRNLDLIAVIDPDAPRVLWWWGPGELSGQHQPSQLAGGTILVFDNGVRSRRSRVLEIDPVSKRIVWSYGTKEKESFFSELAGGCERLPNGNTLISVAQGGNALQVTPEGWKVWVWSTRKEPGAKGASRVTFYRLSGVPKATADLLIRPSVTGTGAVR